MPELQTHTSTRPKGGGRARPKAPQPRALEDLGTLELLGACKALGAFWDLGPEVMAELLGSSRSTWFRWLESLPKRREPSWSADQRARALALLRVFEAAGDLEQGDGDLAAWPHQPMEGPAFQGRAPIEVMRAGFEGLLAVRDYLDFVLHGWS